MDRPINAKRCLRPVLLHEWLEVFSVFMLSDMQRTEATVSVAEKQLDERGGIKLIDAAVAVDVGHRLMSAIA